ncbi:MAG TPA: heme ABC exporter ATP-binding protein CcmA [Nevskiaceae bacterium]|nr:heme ABC exporter ATP-binding protein CcmA [Nevskiaceae bacterium]
MDTLLTASNLTVARGDRTLLSAFRLVVVSGDAVHLRGRNGAGKTSLLEVLAGVRRPAAGEVTSAGPTQIHWLGHRNALHIDLTASENLDYWCALHHVDPKGIPAALERVGLDKVRRRPVRTYSAGQKRRAALARLFLVRRPLWLLDEPLSGLDAHGVALFGATLAEHIGTGGAAVVTSHQALPGRLPRVTTIELA